MKDTIPKPFKIPYTKGVSLDDLDFVIHSLSETVRKRVLKRVEYLILPVDKSFCTRLKFRKIVACSHHVPDPELFPRFFAAFTFHELVKLINHAISLPQSF